MKKALLTGNEAAAWGARLAEVDYIPAFPITPQTEIIEKLSAWVEEKKLDAAMVTLESEHSMMTAAGAAAAAGTRVFTATSSQGLLYSLEMLYAVAGWRVPLVLVNVSRGISAPITLEPDHNDVLAARDTGFLQFHCASCQEVLDGVLMAYRLAEDRRVRLPVLVNLDGFHLSFTREPVELPGREAVRRFLPAFQPGETRFAADAPRAQSTVALEGSLYSYFRYQLHLASLEGLEVFEEAALEFGRLFGRWYEPVEGYRMEDAEYAFFMIGAFSTKGKEAVDGLRAEGWRMGLVRPRLLRPFPAKRVAELLAGLRGVAVVDQNLSVGMGGVLHAEVSGALVQYGVRPAAVAGFVAGLGGRDITQGDFFEMAHTLRKAAESGENPPTRLIYTREEQERTEQLQKIATGG